MKLVKFSALIAALAMVFVVAQVQAAVTIRYVPGNPPCAAGSKIDPVADGTYAMQFGDFTGSITIDVRSTSAGQVFDFDTDSPFHVVTSVTVKGGPNANVYTFDPAVASADGLHAPVNPSGKWAGLSHLCFSTLKK